MFIVALHIFIAVGKLWKHSPTSDGEKWENQRQKSESVAFNRDNQDKCIFKYVREKLN